MRALHQYYKISLPDYITSPWRNIYIPYQNGLQQVFMQTSTFCGNCMYSIIVALQQSNLLYATFFSHTCRMICFYVYSNFFRSVLQQAFKCSEGDVYIFHAIFLHRCNFFCDYVEHFSVGVIHAIYVFKAFKSIKSLMSGIP